MDNLFLAFRAAVPERALYEENLRAVVDQLTRVHGFSLDPSDAPAIGEVYATFFSAGPDLRFVSSRPGNWYPSFEILQRATDGSGVPHGYLAREERFQRLRALQQANAIVPVVGDFGGGHALRAIGEHLRAHGATVSVFYTSNVERYLFRNGRWGDFAANVASLPLARHATFIRSCFDSCSSAGESRSVTLLDSMPVLLRDVQAGRVTTYWDVLSHSRRR